jgi:hypothetical protein
MFEDVCSLVGQGCSSLRFGTGVQLPSPPARRLSGLSRRSPTKAGHFTLRHPAAIFFAKLGKNFF